MIEDEIDIYKEKKTKKCWKVSEWRKDDVILRRGSLPKTVSRTDLKLLFEAVA